MGIMDEKKDDQWAAEERIENVSLQGLEEVNGSGDIEKTATSKAAWLITLTVSLGGFLFGKY